MTAHERLERRLGSLRRRLRASIYARGLAALTSGVLLVTCAAVWLLAREQYAPAIVIAARIALSVLVCVVVATLLWTPLRRLRRDDGAEAFEQCMPEQRGRISTYLDSRRTQGSRSALIDLLIEDAAAIADRTTTEQAAPRRRLAIAAGIGAIALLALTMLLIIGPGYWGFGARHILLGAQLPRSAAPERRIIVTPGDATVRRNSDLAIRASIEGFRPQGAEVYVRFADRSGWERAPMQSTGGNASQFEFRLYAVRGPLSYYVDAGGARSAVHEVAVVDLPKIERVRLTYSYPEWTGLESTQQEQVRDIRAVAGSSVKVEVFADAPLEAPALIVDGAARDMTAQNPASVGVIEVEKPGKYQIGARVAGEFVALSEEYPIEIVEDRKPVVEIRKPGRDWRATSIEEVPVHIQAHDDFRLRNVELRYSVNGGEWRSMRVGGGVKQSDGRALLRLEDIGAQQQATARLVPGDLITYYAVASDRNSAVQTDLYMVQVQPFERRFRQAQAGASGGGGMGDEQGAISERQREILLATWNLQRNDDRSARSREQLRDNARMLAELQARLSKQAQTLAQRTRARAMLDDERIRTFVESLERAAAAMDPAAKHLRQYRLAQAVPVEQQALQQLLRAESAFRDVHVSMQQDSSSGGGQAARNFTEMFELEMDLEKNQYESESELSMQNRQQELEEAIRKLRELAARQQRLAQEANRSRTTTEEQRWKQEQLRREAEDLRRRLAEIARQQHRSGSQSDAGSDGESGGEASDQASGEASSETRSASSGPPSGPSSDQARSGQRSSEPSRRELDRALDSLNRALDNMRAANERTQRGDDNGARLPRDENASRPAREDNAARSAREDNAARFAREAGEDLRRALSGIRLPEPSGLDQTLEQLAQRAGRIGAEQRRIDSELHRAVGQSPGSQISPSSQSPIERTKAQELVQAKQRLAADLGSLQSDLRSAAHEYRKRSPQTTQRVGEIIREMEVSEVMHRLNRSAAEIYYGRAREAVLREGLISEAIENLERGLRQAAALASREGERQKDVASPERLLAEVAELRRALEEAQGSMQESSPDARGRLHQGGSARSAADAERRSRRQQAGTQGGASPGDIDTRPAPLRALQAGRALAQENLARETAAIGERVLDAATRMSRGELTPAQLEALRRRASELRRLADDPMADQREEMLKLIDQIELAALEATPGSQDAAAARAPPPSDDAPNDRDSVAEYYRRLGGR